MLEKYFNYLVDTKKMSTKDIKNFCEINDRTLRILLGDRKTEGYRANKKTLLKITIGMELTYEECVMIFAYAGLYITDNIMSKYRIVINRIFEDRYNIDDKTTLLQYILETVLERM